MRSRKWAAIGSGENFTEEPNHVGEGEVARLRIKPRTFVAHEGMFGRVELHAVVDAQSTESALDGLAPCGGHVGIARAKDQEQPAADLPGTRQRTGIRVLAELAVVNSRAVVAHRRANVRFEGRAKRQMTADAEAHGA